VGPIVEAWAATSDFVTTARWQAAGHAVEYSLGGLDAAGAERLKQRLATLEVFNASSFATLGAGVTRVQVGPAAQQELAQGYQALCDSVYGALVMQIRLRPYLDAVELVIDEQGVRLDGTGIAALALQRAHEDPLRAVAD